MGRPRKKIDATEVKKLAELQCTYDEIAAFLGCDKSTLSRRFATEIAKGREVGKISLRRAQFNTAINGNATMQIWLGKQYLDQIDTKEVTIPNAGEYFKEIADAISGTDTHSGRILPKSN